MKKANLLFFLLFFFLSVCCQRKAPEPIITYEIPGPEEYDPHISDTVGTDEILYRNSTYGSYSVRIPKSFKPGLRTYLDEGRGFYLDSLTTIGVSSCRNVIDDTQTLEGFYTSYCDSTDTKQIYGDNRLVRIGVRNNGICYNQSYIWTKDVIYSLRFEYPNDHGTMMDSVMKRVLDSWKTR